jgi:parallel beta-helix repeat protein
VKVYSAFLLMCMCAPLSATVNVKSFGAAGDGVTNDTSALNDAFAVGCATSQPVYIPTGIYLIDPLAMLNGCGTTFYGDGSSHSVLRFNTKSSLNPNVVQSLWSFTAGSGKTLSISNIGLQGNHGKLAGLSINHYSSVNIRSLYVINFGTAGYAQNHRSPFDGLYLINSENVTINYTTSIGNERYGIELQADHYSTVSNSTMSGNGAIGGVSEENYAGPLDGPKVAQWLNNTLSTTGAGGIDVETASNLPAVQGILKGNVVTDCGNNNWGYGWGLTLGLNAFGVIQSNEVDNFAAHATSSTYTNAIVYGANAGAIQIANNTVNGTRTYGILGNEGKFPVTISGNTVHANGTGIFIYDSPGVQLMNNIVTNNVNAGIAVYWSDGGTISGNQYSANNPDLIINGTQAADR